MSALPTSVMTSCFSAIGGLLLALQPLVRLKRQEPGLLCERDQALLRVGPLCVERDVLDPDSAAVLLHPERAPPVSQVILCDLAVPPQIIDEDRHVGCQGLAGGLLWF